MTLPLQAPLLPGNLAQQVVTIQGVSLAMQAPVADTQGVAYDANTIDGAWFGMADRTGAFGPQLSLNHGVTLDTSDTTLPPMLVIALGSNVMAGITPGEYTFLIAASISGQIIAIAGGIIQISKSPIDWA